MNYIYKAIVTNVHDGDTITVDIDLGLYVTLRDNKIRLYGINAPELSNKPLGQQSTKALADRILGKEITIQTFKDSKEKYGRWLGLIFLDGENINEWLVVNKFANRYMENK